MQGYLQPDPTCSNAAVAAVTGVCQLGQTYLQSSVPFHDRLYEVSEQTAGKGQHLQAAHKRELVHVQFEERCTLLLLTLQHCREWWLLIWL